jgi:hypothetical protein
MTAQRLDSPPTVIFAVDFGSDGVFRAMPIGIVRRGTYYKPPCFDERWSGARPPGWLTKGMVLDVVRGGHKVARGTAVATANADEDGCLGMIVPLEGLSAEALDLRAREQMLAISGPPLPPILRAVKPLQGTDEASLRGLAIDVLRQQGVSERAIAVMVTEVHEVSLSREGPAEAILTGAIFNGVPEDDDFHVLLLIARKHDNNYRSYFIEYERVSREQESHFCSKRLIDVLDLDTYASAVAIVRWDCYEGASYSFYAPWGRVYSGPYYGL